MIDDAGRALFASVRIGRAYSAGRAFALAAAMALLAPSLARAQAVPSPEPFSTVDPRGVNMSSGALHVSSPGVSIGQPGMGGLAYRRQYDSSIQDWRDNVTGTIDASGTVYTVTLMGASERFNLSAGVYSSQQGTGSTLAFDAVANIYTYTMRDGSVALFDKDLASTQPTKANQGRVTTITAPSGEVLTFTYTHLTDGGSFSAHRLQSLTNNLGYQLSFKYENNDPDASGINLIEVTAINNAEEYCDPTANGCVVAASWPTLSFGMDGTAFTVTDELSRTTRYAVTSGRITGIRWPSSSSDDVTVAYNAGNGRVTSVTSAAGTWTYGATPGYVTDPLGHTQTYYVNSAGQVQSFYNGAHIAAVYTYDSQNRLTRIEEQDDNYTNFTYDARGNVTETRQVAKPGSGLADIVATATYPASCTGGGVTAATCNLPTSTTDARGYTTDYTYHPTHGGLLTVTAPDPDGAGNPLVRPQTRYAYSQLLAFYRNSSGQISPAPSPVYRLTEVSACATASSCDGDADETVTTIAYDSPNTLNNLLPSSVSSGAGNGLLTALTTVTYDSVGNMLTVDGPLSADTARVLYDGLRRRVGSVGPDPDGAGALKHRAVRYSYDTHGWVTSVERGTVDSQLDADWSGFTALEQLSVAYDGAGRRTRASFIAGGSTHAVTQYSYDAASRLDCVAVRMNPAVFGSLPSSACTLGAEGANGPDRIARTTYDNANRPMSVISGYGTSAQQTTASQMYNWNNEVTTLTDANGNVTTYEYDGFDRLRKIRFPNASGTGSSTTDYEQYTYDANSNVTQDRRRDGATISLAYDNLNRATTMTPSAGASVSYAYDNFSRMTQASFTGHTLTFGFDQLSRNVSAGGPLGTVSYQYDLAGRRTRITWPGSPTFYAQYDYDMSGAVTAIRENGASSGAGVLATYAYDNLGRRTSVTRGNGVVTTYDFDAAGRLDELVQQLDGTSHDQTLTFAYNAAGQATSRTGSNSSYVWDQPAPSVANSTANGLNQIAALFTHDGRGNLTGTGAATYSYDVYNRLTGANGATLAYDPAGRLYQTVSGSAPPVTTRFLYDGADTIAEYDDGTAGLLRRYVHGPGIDEPIVWYEGSGTSDRRWLVQDRLGSVIAVTDGAGAALSINTYDEYGVPSSSNAGRFQYTGQMWIAEAGLYHYKARAYAPSLGRFLQSDPILYAGGMNLYAYVGNDPVNWIDPRGLDLQKPKEPPKPIPSLPEIIVGGVRTHTESGVFGNAAALVNGIRNGSGQVAGDGGGGGGGEAAEEGGEASDEIVVTGIRLEKNGEVITDWWDIFWELDDWRGYPTAYDHDGDGDVDVTDLSNIFGDEAKRATNPETRAWWERRSGEARLLGQIYDFLQDD